jgi:hypothetical protein
LPAPSGPKVDLDVVELDIFHVMGLIVAGGGCRRDYGDAWILVDSSLGFLEDGAGNREMLGFATGRIAFEGVMNNAFWAVGVAGAEFFGADAMI